MKIKLLVASVLSFSLASGAYANGRLEDARQLFYHDVYDAYNETIKYLEAENTKDGEESLKKLHKLTNELSTYSSSIMTGTETLGATLNDIWKPVYHKINNLNIAVGGVEERVGRGDLSSQLSNLKDQFEGVKSELEKASDMMKDFGHRFQIICDTCK